MKMRCVYLFDSFFHTWKSSTQLIYTRTTYMYMFLHRTHFGTQLKSTFVPIHIQKCVCISNKDQSGAWHTYPCAGLQHNRAFIHNIWTLVCHFVASKNQQWRLQIVKKQNKNYKQIEIKRNKIKSYRQPTITTTTIITIQ